MTVRVVDAAAQRRELRRRLRALAVRDLSLDELFGHADEVLRRAIGWDFSAWGTVDPATLLSTSCQVIGIPMDPDRERVVFALEWEDDVNRLIDLVDRRPPAGALHVSTGGRPERSRRYAQLLTPNGAHDDLRLALVADGLCWGSVYAYRRAEAFTRDDVDLAGSAAGDLADAVRLCLLRGAAARPVGDDQPGMLVLDSHGHVILTTESAERWLDQLADPGALPPVVTALWGALYGPEPGPRRARVRARDGSWLVLHAARAKGTDDTTALVIERARPVEIAEVLVHAYGLTPRQRDVVGLALRGASNRVMARDLSISEHTAKEHLKAAFAKIGVVSRGELAARLLHEQYAPRAAARWQPGPHGWFREPATLG